MESQVKERIVGAAVLVVLGVWLIPWVLDGSSEAPAEQDVAERLTLPAGDDSRAPVRTETVALDPVAPVPEPVAETPPEKTDSDTARPEPLLPTGPTDSAAGEAAVDEPEASSGEAVADAGNSPASLPPPAPEAAADSWAVQLGAFSELANANQLVARLETFGFDASVSEVRSGGQTFNRVRVGGFASENQAEAAASSLSAHGFRPRVIPPEE